MNAVGDTGDEMLAGSSDDVMKGDENSEPVERRGLEVVNGIIGRLIGDDRFIAALATGSNLSPELSSLSNFTEVATLAPVAGCTVASSVEVGWAVDEDEGTEVVLVDMCGGGL